MNIQINRNEIIINDTELAGDVDDEAFFCNENLFAASVRDGKIGSLYFRCIRTNVEQRRIRLVHTEGPYMSRVSYNRIWGIGYNAGYQLFEFDKPDSLNLAHKSRGLPVFKDDTYKLRMKNQIDAIDEIRYYDPSNTVLKKDFNGSWSWCKQDSGFQQPELSLPLRCIEDDTIAVLYKVAKNYCMNKLEGNSIMQEVCKNYCIPVHSAVNVVRK